MELEAGVRTGESESDMSFVAAAAAETGCVFCEDGG